MIGRIGIAAMLLALGIVQAAPARAEWLEARTRHFILYNDTGEAALRRQAIALERLDWALRRFMKVEDTGDAATNKLTVFVTSDAGIRALCRCENVGGFYLGRVSGSVAFSGWGRGDGDLARVILFHEYAHHFLLGSYGIAFPTWYAEGFAEFASTIRITDDEIVVGGAAQHRAHGLLVERPLPAAAMFDPGTWRRLEGGRIDAFYGRGWLLTHYLTFDQARFAQFRRYLAALNGGTAGPAAARAAFGDLAALDRDLADYLGRSRLPALVMRTAGAAVPEVAIRRVSAGEAAMMRMRMESLGGVDRQNARALLARARPVAERHADDPVVQGWLAEMAYDAGEDAAAEQAAGRALAADPALAQALLYQARARLRVLAARREPDAARWTAARRPILAVNRRQPDLAEPLWLFWQSFGMEGRRPVASAVKGLYRAQELAPQDRNVRFAAAVSRLSAGEMAEARVLLRPLAYDPHAPADNPAARMLAALEAGRSGAEVIAVGERRPAPTSPTVP